MFRGGGGGFGEGGGGEGRSEKGGERVFFARTARVGWFVPVPEDEGPARRRGGRRRLRPPVSGSVAYGTPKGARTSSRGRPPKLAGEEGEVRNRGSRRAEIKAEWRVDESACFPGLGLPEKGAEWFGGEGGTAVVRGGVVRLAEGRDQKGGVSVFGGTHCSQLPR